MRKICLLAFSLIFSLAACGQASPAMPTATIVPSRASTPVTFIMAKEINLETQTGTAYTLDWSPDGKTLAIASGYEITLVSHDLNEIHTVLRPEGGGLAVSWSPDRTRLATVNGYRNRTIKLWELNQAEEQLDPAGEIRAASDQYAVFWSPDGKLLATLADDDKTTFQIWDARTGEELDTHELPYATALRTAQWSLDSATLYAAAESDAQIVFFALNVSDGSWEEITSFPANVAAVFALSPDSKILALSDPRGVVEFIDLESGGALTGIKSVDQPVDLSWSPSGDALAILGYKTELQLWRLEP
jgi:WD40 repeat protein